jgi:transcriptional regulator with XRE-family HTH domain
MTTLHKQTITEDGDRRMLTRTFMLLQRKTQYHLADAIERSRGYVSEILNGHTTPTKTEAEKIAKLLRVDAELIFPEVREDCP